MTEVELLADDLREVIGRFVRAVRAHAPTPSDARAETLAFLERTGPVSIALLADGRGVTHQTMRLVIARLASEGWLELVSDPQDRRGYLVHLTEKGVAENAAARKARAEWIADALAATMDPREMATLRAAVPLLQRIADLALQ
ncbi:MarR family winged helix-turn-helix transcriptional regulator [Niveibacterium sp.]|uniref:MarR family winged helix-turn-helix transcriptional regulator n=1 Tax=Niveibacterium sp. TaxID=2017444 RepID=UPI0035B09361